MTDPLNQSPGLKRLYDRINPEGWNNFSRLKLELSKHYIKPEVVKFISFMYQNFTYHTGESGCVVRLSYLDLLSDDLDDPLRFESGGEIVSAITELDNANNLEIASYMSRGFEDWRIKELPASSVKPIYSENFLNFWLNNNHCAINNATTKAVQFSKVVSSVDTNSPYYLYGDDVDGVILSCNSITLKYTTEGDVDVIKYYNGLYQPLYYFTDIKSIQYSTSLLRWNAANDKMEPMSNSLTDSAQCGVMHFPAYDSTNTVHNFYIQTYPQSKPTIFTSISSMVQVCNDAYRYLLYPNSSN